MSPSWYLSQLVTWSFQLSMSEWILWLVNIFSIGSFHGAAFPNYSIGSHCQYADYACQSIPCLNNGTCSIVGDSYQCNCVPGLTGTRCEIDIDECSSQPCLNKGICMQSILNEYQCRCPKGKYIGVLIIFSRVVFRLYRTTL